MFVPYLVHYDTTWGCLKFKTQQETLNQFRQAWEDTFDWNLPTKFFKDFCNFRAYKLQIEVFYMEIIVFQKDLPKVTLLTSSFFLLMWKPLFYHFPQTFGSKASWLYLMFFPSHLFTPFLSQKVALSYN